LWLHLKSHNAFRHLKKSHDAKFVSWLVKKTIRTRCDKLWPIFRKGDSKLTVYKLSNVFVENTCKIGLIKKNGEAHSFLQELLQWHLELYLIFFERHLHFLSMQYLLQLLTSRYY
jgi:hypothetical protein